MSDAHLDIIVTALLLLWLALIADSLRDIRRAESEGAIELLELRGHTHRAQNVIEMMKEGP